MEDFKAYHRSTDFGKNVPYRDTQVHESLTSQQYDDDFKYNSIFNFATAAIADAASAVTAVATTAAATAAAAAAAAALKIEDSSTTAMLSLHGRYCSNIETLRACNRARRNSSKNVTKTELYDASIQTDCIMDFSAHRDGVEVMTQRNVVRDIDKTAVCDVSTQTDCPDFLNVHRGEPDGSRTDSMTHVKTV